MQNIPDRRVKDCLARLQATPIEQAHTEQTEQLPPQSAQPRPPVRSVGRELGSLGIKIVLIVLVFGLLFTLVYGFHRQTEPGMTPMVKSGDLVLFYRLDRDYAIGDLLLLDFQGERQVRRVVAGPGDAVDIADGGLIINGAIQQEPEIYQQTWRYEHGVSFPLVVGDGQVFVLGDARDGATDSRIYGPVHTGDTLGTVITVIRRRNL